LGEQTHSPVDIKAHQQDRIDNQIDVLTKTFQGLTVACARCHDHKFDAISTADYYALYGILQSTRSTPTELLVHTDESDTERQLQQLRGQVESAIRRRWDPNRERVDQYLLRAQAILTQTAGI